MEYCVKCGAENDDGYVYCYQCGAKNEAAAAAGGAAKMAYTEGISRLTQDRSAGMMVSRDLGEALIDPDEQVIAQLGNGYASAFIATGRAGKLNATLTDRRVYLKGKFYNGKESLGGPRRKIWRNFRNLFKRSVQDQILDVRDVTGTWFEYNDDLWHIVWVVLCVILFIVAICIGIAKNVPAAFALAMIFLVISVVQLLCYFLSRHTDFCIEYAGGVISFQADIVGVPAVRDFHRQLRRVKDRHMDMQEGRR